MGIRKRPCEIKNTDSTIRLDKCENYKEVRADGVRDKKELIKI